MVQDYNSKQQFRTQYFNEFHTGKKVGDKVLYHFNSLTKSTDNPYEGLYKIVHIYTDGTVQLKMRAVTDVTTLLNIRLIQPYRN